MTTDPKGRIVVPRRLRLGMVGGGQEGSIGHVHRIAARLDDGYELVAGALSSDPARTKASALRLRIAPDRAYDGFAEMARAEAARTDGIDVVAIVAPNHIHYPAAKAFLEAGIHVICDKPMTKTLDEALDLVATVKRTGLVFALTHNYTGYAMVRQARAMLKAGEIGTVRVVQVDYPQGSVPTGAEDLKRKLAEWRNDPSRAGQGGSIGDLGTHAFHLASYITGLELEELCADLSRFVPGQNLDDNAHILLRYKGGARGMLWSSKVAIGNANALKIRIYGDRGGLEWEQEHPDRLYFTALGEGERLITRGGVGSGAAAARVTRIPAGHPEGYLEGFANIYRDAAEVIFARLEGRDPPPLASAVPSVEDGARGVKFIAAAVESSERGGIWVNAELLP